MYWFCVQKTQWIILLTLFALYFSVWTVMALTLTLTLTLILTQIMRVLPLLLQSVTSFIYFCLTGLTTISIYFWINFWMFADDLLPMSDLKLYTFNISPLNVIFAEFFFLILESLKRLKNFSSTHCLPKILIMTGYWILQSVFSHRGTILFV